MFLVLRGGSENSKFSQFQIFPKLGTRGGVVKFQIFPKFKKVQIILGEGGGVKKIVDFSHFWGVQNGPKVDGVICARSLTLKGKGVTPKGGEEIPRRTP